MSLADNGAQRSAQYSSSADDAMKKNIPPPKRDFQEANPPKSLQELYDRYDPSIGAGIAIALGSLLIYLMAQVAIKFVCKNIRRKLSRTKKFGKYFPEKKFPPLHIVQKLAAEQGIEIPEYLLNKLIAEGVSVELDQQKTGDKLTSAKKSSSTNTASTLATMLTTTPKSPEDIFFNKACQSIHPSFLRETEISSNMEAAQGIITVNIIGATPSITPNPSHKPYYPPCPTYTQIVPAKKILSTTPTAQFDVNYDNVVVTTATIEKFPLLNEDFSRIKSSSNIVNANVPSSCAKCAMLPTSDRCYYHANLLIKNETVL